MTNTIQTHAFFVHRFFVHRFCSSLLFQCQAMKPTPMDQSNPEPTVVGLRFVPCGSATVPTLIHHTVPGRSQPYHVAGSTGST